VYVVKETYLDISLSLISSAKQKKTDVTEVLSHPHALAQCQNYLRSQLPQAVLAGVASTASAVEKIKDKPGMAAIAMTSSAADAGMLVLAEDIQDQPSRTRFLALDSKPGAGAKTSIIFALKDKPGALYNVLGVFAEKKINLTKIESRPARTRLGDYIFFIDYENQGIDAQKILGEIKSQTTFTKHLGSY
ncbi:MAG: ACT domain-containing protein, partial [Candidatus Altiarchaeales archaeon]|nr:ACT domain-containing protein [Candidatus Altiarchaeales archaeon]